MTDTTQTHEHGPRRGALHVAFVLDESGSMRPLTSAVVAGFDEFLKELRADGGDTYFSLTLFDTAFSQVHLATPLEFVPSLARSGYRPGGGTALLDAIAHTVISTDERLARAGRGDDKVLVAVLTDGRENASREHTISTLAQLISGYQARPNWTFAFLSAAHDTVENARDFAELLSFSRANAMRWSPDSTSVRKSMHALGKAARHRRSAASLKSERFFDEAGQNEADYRDRSGKSIMSTYSIYVIELEEAVCNRTACPSRLSGKPHVYVGETAKTPEERFAVHLAGVDAAVGAVTRHGIRLRPRLYRNWGPYETREASREAEASLAKKLSRRGFCVRGGH